MTISQALQAALQHHQAGRVADAEALYRQILGAQPSHPDALNLLGNLASQTGRHEMAVDYLQQAIAVSPNDWRYHYGFGNALLALGRLSEACAAFRATLQLNPHFEMALNNLAVILRVQGAFGIGLWSMPRPTAAPSQSLKGLTTSFRPAAKSGPLPLFCGSSLQLDPF